MADFVIHELRSGGGVLGISPMPGRSGPYFDDWVRLVDWRPNLVVTMTQQDELNQHQAGTLGLDLTLSDIVWHHVPVVDFGTPDQAIMAHWSAAEAASVAMLATGGRVLVHCFGGCGRSGMALLRIMRAAGEDGDVALTRLRQTRPCAIETEAQMAWAMAH